ncbi:hypothetical protein SLE2022_148180 [Rubroshorea leprosula]
MARQFLADSSNPPPNSTAVAIDKDKNSPYAVRWAIDHLVINNPFIILIHVRKHHDGDSDSEFNSFFVPFRGYCARKGVQFKEVIIDESDVVKGLVNYISKNLISNIVVGGTTRNALARKFKNNDISSSLLKAVPDFCSVYVISKGKVQTVRTAQRPISNTAAPPKVPSPVVPLQTAYDQGEDDESKGQATKGKTRNPGSGRTSLDGVTRGLEKHKPVPNNLSVDSIDYSVRGASTGRESTPDDLDFQIGSKSIDISSTNLDLSSAPSSPKESAPQSAQELEAEMRRLKLELKQTMDMYSSACKEALTAKKRASELHQWKMDEVRRIEEARLAEEAALSIVEMEKAKAKAAIEAAAAAQRLAELEAQRRKQAEMKAKKETEEKNRALNALAHNDVRYRKYTIEEIEEATENFAPKNKIGEGGYGPVYKGTLDHTPVAIKVLRPDAAQGMKQFQQEVEILSCIRHPNLVLLLGACPEYGCLVYEYMSHGSLEDRLFQRGKTHPISWRKRFKIASEIATALLFLHQSKPEPLVHRDLKPANILLDRNYVSKISDVGLARLVPPSIVDSVTQYHMTSAAGTFCYIDPEYQQTGMLTTKSDIYSLGIMLLQIITAKSPMGLAHHVGKAIEKGTFVEMLDPAVPDWPVEEALAFAKLSLQCAELRKKDRPDLGTIIVPELNRLRDLGMRPELSLVSTGNSSHSHSRLPRSLATTSSLQSLHPRISSSSQESTSKCAKLEVENVSISKDENEVQD